MKAYILKKYVLVHPTLYMSIAKAASEISLNNPASGLRHISA
jgi:hypothetical protein